MARQFASHNDYVKLEALVESGLSVYQSAQQIGLPLGAFKSRQGDREWYEQIKAKEETCRAAAVDNLIDRRVQSGEAGDALTARWAGRNHPDFREKTQVELSGELEVLNPDIAQAIERFTTAVVQLTERRRAELADPGDAAGGAGGPRLALARVDGETGPASSGG